MPQSPVQEEIFEIGSPHSEEVKKFVDAQREGYFSPVFKHKGPQIFMKTPHSASPTTSKYCSICRRVIPAGKWQSHMRKEHKTGFRKKSR